MALFSRRTAGAASTGHPGDDALPAEIAARSALTEPRHWVHYLYCGTEAGARQAAAEAVAAGWSTRR